MLRLYPNTSDARDRRLDARESSWARALFIVNVLLLALLAYRHVMWRDESAAWLVGRDSSSLHALFYPMHYQGHPPLWYVLLYGLARISWNPVWIKLLTLLFSVATSGVLFFATRLPLWMRAGFAFSYFFLFEYGTIERNYLPGILALLISAVLLVSARSSSRYHAVWWLCAAVLCSDPTLLLAGAMLLLWFWRDHLTGSLPGGWSRSLPRPGEIVALLVFGLCLLASYLVVHPPADSNLFLAGNAPQLSPIRRALGLGSTMASAFLPLPPLQARFWDLTVWSEGPLSGHHISTVLGLLVFVGLVLSFRRTLARWCFVVGTFTIAVLLVGSGHIYLRHAGFFLVVLLIAQILEHGLMSPLPIERRPLLNRPLLVGSVLCIQVIAGAFAFAVNVAHPFSAARQVADFLKAQNLAAAPLIIEPGRNGSSILAYLQRPNAYSLEFHAPASYVIWNMQEMQTHLPSLSEMTAASDGAGPPVLIVEKPLTADKQRELGVQPIAHFDTSVSIYDRYYLYR